MLQLLIPHSLRKKTDFKCLILVRWQSGFACGYKLISMILIYFSVCPSLTTTRKSVLLGCMSFGVRSLMDANKVSLNREITGRKIFCKQCPFQLLCVYFCVCVCVLFNRPWIQEFNSVWTNSTDLNSLEETLLGYQCYSSAVLPPDTGLDHSLNHFISKLESWRSHKHKNCTQIN